MNTESHLLGVVVDGVRGDTALNTDAFDAAVDAAARRTVETLGDDGDEGFDAEKLHRSLTTAIADEGVVDRVDAHHDEGTSVDGDDLLAEELPRLAADADELALPEGGWERVAATFLDSLQAELVAVGTESGESILERLGDAALVDGDAGAAEAHYEAGLEGAREVGDRSTEAACLAGLGNVALQRDDLETAEEYHRRGLEIAREIDDRAVESNCLGSLGTIAGRREAFEMAEAYLGESLDLKRLLDDTVGEAMCLAALGGLAEDRSEYATAVDRYTEASELFSSVGRHRERLESLRGLVECETARGHEAAAVERCEEALALLEDGELETPEADRRWFESMRARLTGDPEAIESLYRWALERIRADDDLAAFELLGGLWDCREHVDDGSRSHDITLRAGVGYATYHLLLEAAAVESTCESVLSEITPDRERLTEPAVDLLRFAESGGADREIEIDTPGVDDAEPSLEDLERIAYAEFLERISATPPPSELYAAALTAITDGGDREAVLQQCLLAWNQRVDEADEELSRATIGSGLLAEAHRDLFGIELPTDREAVLDAAAEGREMLSDPLVALFERLDSGSTGTEPAALRAAADEDDPALIDIERLVVAGFLDGL
ncbi:MAG: tetratricopeptide repeat protein [Halohasta sp.]